MTKLEGGRYDARVTPGGAPELAAICSKLNHLAATLGEAVEDKRRLAERAVSLQDIERKEIARELHDEFGPYLLLAARACERAGEACRRTRPESGRGAQAWQRHDGADQCAAAIQSPRLERLRPVGLAELGLRQALGVAVAAVAESHPTSRSTPRSRRHLAPPARPPTSPSTASCRRRSPTCSATPARPPSTSLIEPADAAELRMAAPARGSRVSDNGRGMAPGPEARIRPRRHARADSGAWRHAQRGVRRGRRDRGSAGSDSAA